MMTLVRILQRLGIVIALLSGLTTVVHAQTQPPCTTERELIKRLDDQVSDQKAIIANLGGTKQLLEQKLQLTEQKIAEMQKQIDLQEENKKLLRDMIETQTKMLDVQVQSIKDRDTVIKELAKNTKESVWKKIAESIPAVAAIIAAAVVSH